MICHIIALLLPLAATRDIKCTGPDVRTINGTCVCINCGINPPYCNQLNCHGGKVVFSRLLLPSQTSSQRISRCKCENGFRGKCCSLIGCQSGIANQNGTCTCIGHQWEGRLCDVPICINNGTLGCLVPNNTACHPKCICPTGYFGLHCERRLCGDHQKNKVDWANGTSTCIPVKLGFPTGAIIFLAVLGVSLAKGLIIWCIFLRGIDWKAMSCQDRANAIGMALFMFACCWGLECQIGGGEQEDQQELEGETAIKY